MIHLSRILTDLSDNREQPEQEPEPEKDWDEAAAVDDEAAVEAEILRRRRAREEAFKRAVGAATPTVQGLQLSEKATASTPASTRHGTPLRVEANTPRSGKVQSLSQSPRLQTNIIDLNSPAASVSAGQEAMSPASLDIANDQELINTHWKTKVNDEDGPSAADYDPTADMKEDELRDELRHGHVGLHGKDRHASQAEIAAPLNREPEKKDEGGAAADDDDDFDMFADDFDDEKFAAPKAPAKATAARDNQDAAQLGQPNGGGILEGDDKDGYYKIRPGEVLGGRYQVQSTLGRGMFSGVARAIDITTKMPVAIKIMRNNDALRKGGFTEIAILQKLNAADPDGKKHIVKFEHSFEYKGHLCMAFESLSLNLREVLKKFGNNIGINLNATRAYAYQIFLALGHMRKCSVIHADLKPDNILVSYHEPRP
jgi:serine/threonine-protein kinase PRP4